MIPLAQKATTVSDGSLSKILVYCICFAKFIFFAFTTGHSYILYLNSATGKYVRKCVYERGEYA